MEHSNSDVEDPTEEDLEMEMQHNDQEQHKQLLMSPRRSLTGRKSPSSFSKNKSGRPGSPLATTTDPTSINNMYLNLSGVEGETKSTTNTSNTSNTSKKEKSPPRFKLAPQARQPPRSPRIKVRKATQMLFERPMVESPKDVPNCPEFQRMNVTGVPETHSKEAQEVGRKITRAMSLRDKYLIPMPINNWGGLNPELYEDFMKEKKKGSIEGEGGQNSSIQSNASLFAPSVTPLTPSVTTQSTNTNTTQSSTATATPSLLSSSFTAKTLLSQTSNTSTSSTTSTTSTGARQRLRRRMDVPYNPYYRALDYNVPHDLSNITFQCNNGVFETFSNLSLIPLDRPHISVNEFYNDLVS